MSVVLSDEQFGFLMRVLLANESTESLSVGDVKATLCGEPVRMLEIDPKYIFFSNVRNYTADTYHMKGSIQLEASVPNDGDDELCKQQVVKKIAELLECALIK